jgi:hypothetical protein
MIKVETVDLATPQGTTNREGKWRAALRLFDAQMRIPAGMAPFADTEWKPPT